MCRQPSTPLLSPSFCLFPPFCSSLPPSSLSSLPLLPFLSSLTLSLFSLLLSSHPFSNLLLSLPSAPPTGAQMPSVGLYGGDQVSQAPETQASKKDDVGQVWAGCAKPAGAGIFSSGCVTAALPRLTSSFQVAFHTSRNPAWTASVPNFCQPGQKFHPDMIIALLSQVSAIPCCSAHCP